MGRVVQHGGDAIQKLVANNLTPVRAGLIPFSGLPPLTARICLDDPWCIACGRQGRLSLQRADQLASGHNDYLGLVCMPSSHLVWNLVLTSQELADGCSQTRHHSLLTWYQMRATYESERPRALNEAWSNYLYLSIRMSTAHHWVQGLFTSHTQQPVCVSCSSSVRRARVLCLHQHMHLLLRSGYRWN